MIGEVRCSTHTETLLAINTLEVTMDTRHKMNMWFLRILGGAIILLTGSAITVGINLNSALITITSEQQVCKEIVSTNRRDIATIESYCIERGD